jgi:hypothetical protein
MRSCRYTIRSLRIGFQLLRDNLVHQARNSFLRFDLLKVYPKASNREFKSSKCKKSFGPCLFNMGHFQNRLPQHPNLLLGSKMGPIRLSNAKLQSAAVALRSAPICISSLAYRRSSKVNPLSLPLVKTGQVNLSSKILRSDLPVLPVLTGIKRPYHASPKVKMKLFFLILFRLICVPVITMAQDMTSNFARDVNFSQYKTCKWINIEGTTSSNRLAPRFWSSHTLALGAWF